ncbi:MAG: hypothetical protein WBW94_00195 [Anaerolineales bacterium]
MVTKSLFFPFCAVSVFSILIFFVLYVMGFVLYGTAYLTIFKVSIESLLQPNIFAFYFLVLFLSYLIITIPVTFCFLEAVIKQSSIIESYRQAVKILLKNISHLLVLALMWAFALCLFVFILLLVQSGFSVSIVFGLNMITAQHFTDLPLFRIMIMLYSFISVPFFVTLTVLSYLNFTGQFPLQSTSQ